MIGRQWLKLALAGLLALGAAATPGCSDDPAQASRDSISAPRAGGGTAKVGDDKGGKAGAEGKALGGKKGL